MRGKIIISVSREAEFTEEQRQAMIAAIEFLFGKRGLEDGIMKVVHDAPFGWELDGLSVQVDPKPLSKHEMLYGFEIPSKEEREELIQRAGEQGEKAAQRAATAALADPHHHEDRLPAYPVESLEFLDEVPSRPERSKLMPDAFEHEHEGEHYPKPMRKTLPLCGEKYDQDGVYAECTVDANYKHWQHSNGEFSWGTPPEYAVPEPRVKPKFMRGAEDEDDEYDSAHEAKHGPVQDVELPGMWEGSDFTGGQDEVRPGRGDHPGHEGMYLSDRPVYPNLRLTDYHREL